MSNLTDENLAPLYEKFGNKLSAFEKIGNAYIVLFAIVGGFFGFMIFLASCVNWLKFGNWTEHSLYANGWIFETNAIGYGRLANGFLSLHPIITLPIIGALVIFYLGLSQLCLQFFCFQLG